MPQNILAIHFLSTCSQRLASSWTNLEKGIMTRGSRPSSPWESAMRVAGFHRTVTGEGPNGLRSGNDIRSSGPHETFPVFRLAAEAHSLVGLPMLGTSFLFQALHFPSLQGPPPPLPASELPRFHPGSARTWQIFSSEQQGSPPVVTNCVLQHCTDTVRVSKAVEAARKQRKGECLY